MLTANFTWRSSHSCKKNLVRLVRACKLLSSIGKASSVEAVNNSDWKEQVRHALCCRLALRQYAQNSFSYSIA